MAPSPVLTVLRDPKLRLALIFLPNFSWFFAGFVQFALRSRRWRGALSPSARAQKVPHRIGDAYHQDLLIYLGAFGAALSASVLDAGYQNLVLGDLGNLRWYLRLWAAAHASQGLTGWFRVGPSGRWDWERYLGPITYTDTALTIWDAALAFWYP